MGRATACRAKSLLEYNKRTQKSNQNQLTMVLSGKQVSSFQNLYKEEFGEDISEEEAYIQAAKLIELVRMTYQPITKEDYKKYKLD